jgi:hypothetical protein
MSDEEKLYDALVSVRLFAQAGRISHLQSLDAAMAQNRPSFRAINPAVWDATTNTMRYAAFFRYCRMRDPAAWGQFVAATSAARPHPHVETPGIVNFTSRESQVR